MNPATKLLQAILAFAALLLSAHASQAVQITWDVDSSASYIRLTVPDQNVTVTNLGNVTVRMRDAGNDSQWTDAGGRRAALDGTLLTDYTDGATIRFLSGSNNLVALEQTNLRPNPAQWNPGTTSYVGTATAPAALGARIRGTFLLTFDAAFMALRSLELDIASDLVPITGGSFAGNQSQFGIASALADIDGLALPLGLGQPIPDLLNAQMDPIVQTNSAGGTIENLGGQNRKLTYTVNLPSVTVQLNEMLLTGSLGGQIVAYASLPLESPALRIAQAAESNVLIAWPAAATGFVLQQNSTLGSPGWGAVTNSPVMVGNEWQVTLPASAGGAFYRLSSQ